MSHSNTVLAQLLKLLPRHEFETLANGVDGKVRSTALTRWSQFLALTVGQFNGRQSLRDIETCLNSQQHLHYHLSAQPVSKSSLARANESRSYEFYAQLFEKLYQRCTQGAPKHGFRFKNKLFSLDGSLLDVSTKLFPWADYNLKKSAFKLHLGLDHNGLIPCFARVTEGRTSENEIARQFTAPAGSVVVFDKGYNNYEWHNALTEKGIYWVTRIRGNAKYEIVEEREFVINGKVMSDQIIQYSSSQCRRNRLKPIRLVTYWDSEACKEYQFTTNHFDWSAQTIADIYKQRWQVELFFKWIKQNLKIKSFLGNSKNAILTQVLSALCVYLLVSYLKFQSKVSASMQEICRLLHSNLFAKRDLVELLKKRKPDKCDSLQLRLLLVRS